MKELKENNLFYKKPTKFSKESNKDILKYAVGANLYMNGEKNFYEKIVNGDFEELGTISVCFEDATRDNEVEAAEDNVVKMLDNLSSYNKSELINKIPLIFFRVRNYDQLKRFTLKLRSEHFKYIAGFIFPKFNTENSLDYLRYTKELSETHNEVLYAMPILESESIIYKETRLQELINIKKIIEDYSDIILNIRVGGTDFSSKFGLRRSVESDIYNVRVVSDCLIDIINIFLREGQEYVISAPVWEYFSNDINSNEVKGLINEIKKDKENGFCGKTIIHPSQIKYVNSLYAVTYEEYKDAKNIINLHEQGGVFKGYNNNKMNEVKPHFNWAKRILNMAEAFGVLNEGITRKDLYMNKE